VLHEDSELIVVNKPAGLVVHPGRGHRTGTLVNGLLAHTQFSSDAVDPLDAEGLSRPGIVQRIDKETSGVLVVAKTGRAREHLKRQLAEHSVERVYLALTDGCPTTQVIDTTHARHPRARMKFTSFSERGRRAVTRIKLLEKLISGAAAFVECRLQTGRTHQIRVHLSERAKTPILRDALYGREARSPLLQAAVEQLERHALHAQVLGFEHPTSKERLRFEVPLPEDLQRVLDQLRRL
jgi:23S rRNA pseudouridine1911/1915/1917 synthase